MVYAPIIIPTLNRFDHLRKCIESLRENTWAKYTDIYIAVDFPPAEKYKDGYKKICEYLSNDFPEFHSFNVLKRTKNYGSLKNAGELIDCILSKYDRFIRTDDDIVFSPNFIEFMDRCLDKYENDPNVFAVSGYSYPIQWSVSEGSNYFAENFVLPMWGTGYWKNKFLEARQYISKGGVFKDFAKSIRNGNIQYMTDACLCDYTPPYIYRELLLRVTDISTRIYLANKNKYVITPTLSKSKNLGFDGSGVYCQKIEKYTGNTSSTFNYSQQAIDEATSFTPVEDTKHDLKRNLALMNMFDSRSEKQLRKVKLFILVCRFFGVEWFYSLQRIKHYFAK